MVFEVLSMQISIIQPSNDRAFWIIANAVVVVHTLLLFWISQVSDMQTIPKPKEKRILVQTITLDTPPPKALPNIVVEQEIPKPPEPLPPPPIPEPAPNLPVEVRIEEPQPIPLPEPVPAPLPPPEAALPKPEEPVVEMKNIEPAPLPPPEPEVIKPEPEAKKPEPEPVKKVEPAKPKKAEQVKKAEPAKKPAAVKKKPPAAKKAEPKPKKAEAKPAKKNEAKPKPKKEAEKKPAPPKETAPPKPDPKIEAAKAKRRELLAKAQKSVAKIEQTRDRLTAAQSSSVAAAGVPGKIDNLQVETFISESGPQLSPQEISYYAELANRLKLQLRLPDFGEVKVKLTLERSGKFVKVVVVNTESAKNRAYIEKTLPTVKYTSFGNNFSGQSEYTFVLALSNEI